jgi:hypothetical protein
VNGLLVEWLLAVRAQQSERMRRIGVLMPHSEGAGDGLTAKSMSMMNR